MFKSILLVICFLLSGDLFSGVNLKNGNFFISYKDIVSTSKGISLDLTRTYNSKSTSKGWFGYGWGTPFETRLEVSADGSVIVFENGSGGRARFVASSGVSKSVIQNSVKKLFQRLRKDLNFQPRQKKI